MKVLITTSGIGSRLGELTKYMNKSMVKIGRKPAISYIIESYPKDFEFVVTLGYYGDHIRQFLNIAYPDRKFTFVEVDRYEGKGSSPVYSQLCAEQYLQEPFIYNSCDTYIDNLSSIVPFDFNYNFLVGYRTNSGSYDSFDYNEVNDVKRITNLYRKGESESSQLSYIGIAGIYDYATYWKYMHDCYLAYNDLAPSDFFMYVRASIDNGVHDAFNHIAIETPTWYDFGNIQSITKARNDFKDKMNILDKIDQSIFIFTDQKMVYKFFAKDGVVDKLIEHYGCISSMCPDMFVHTNNFMCYKFVDGKDADINITAPKFRNILEYCNDNGLWDEASFDDNFADNQKKFYVDKTLQRIDDFKRKYNVNENKDLYINNVLIPKQYTVKHMLELMQRLSEWKQHQNNSYTNWHGDFILNNMLINKEGFPVLLDWRESFNGITTCGDKYYDFAKMNHNLTVNHDIIFKNLFDVKESDEAVYVNILVNKTMMECKDELHHFVEEMHDISFNYIELLTGIVWLNMSPLHFYPFDKFLFYLGKYTMYNALMRLTDDDTFYN